MKDTLRRDFEIFSKGIKRLEELRAELDGMNTQGFEAETLAIRAKLKSVSEIPSIERDLKRLRLKISGKYKPKPRKNLVEGKIKEIEKEIEKKLYSCRTNIKYAREVPKLRKQLESLKLDLDRHGKEEQRKKEILKRIDPSLDLLADETFDLSLNDIKAELSERVRNKEADIQKELEEDLKVRETEFKKKYNELDKSFEKKYEQAVEKQLRKEIHEKFNKLLEERVRQRRVELSKQELGELRSKAEKDFEARKEELRRKYIHDLKIAKKQLRNHFEEEVLLHKHELHKKFEQEIAGRVWEIKRKYKEKEKQMLDYFRKKESSELEKNSSEFRNIIEKTRKANVKLSREMEVIKAKLIAQRQRDRREKEKIEAENEMQKRSEGGKISLAKNLADEKTAEKEEIKKLEQQIASMREKLEKKGEGRESKASRPRGEIEKRRFFQRLFSKEKALENKLAKERRLKQELARKSEESQKKLKEMFEDMKKKEKETRSEMEEEKEREIQNSLRKKTDELKNKLRKEFDERLNFEIRRKEEEFERKKAEFEQDVKNKAKLLFN